MDTLFRLDGKTAVVTGAGSGIGEAISELYAARGACVVLVDLDHAAASAVAQRITAKGGDAWALACDVSQEASVQAMVQAVRQRHDHIAILVNNAGVAHVGNALTTTAADFERLFRVNVLGVHHCTQAVLPSMIEHGGGAIVNLASIASFIALKDRWAYSMTKGAVLAMTRATALDFVDQKVRCNCVAPARIHTPFVDGFVAKNYPGREDEIKASLAKYQPVGRMGTPQEVAQLCLYLASDEASFVTGAAYPIDGGVMMQ